MHGKNRINIIGNLGKDPSLSLTAGGRKICRFSVAVNEMIDQTEKTEWFDVIVLDKNGELCQQYLRKGARVDIEGRIETRTAESANGEIRRWKVVVANEVVFLDKRENAVARQDSSESPSDAKSVEAAIP